MMRLLRRGKVNSATSDQNNEKIWGWFFYRDDPGVENYLTAVRLRDRLIAQGEEAPKRFFQTGAVRFYTFWGYFNRSLSFGRYEDHEVDYRVSRIIAKKLDNDYMSCDIEDVISSWPDFHQCIAENFARQLIADKIKIL